MSIIARTILNTCAETLFLRLHARSYYTNRNTHTGAVYIIKRLSGKFKHISVCHNYSSIGVTAFQEVEPCGRDDNIREHKAMHMILEGSKHYSHTVFPPIKTRVIVSSEEISQLYHVDWTIKSGQDVFKAIKKITYCCLDGSRFEISLYDDMLHGLTSKLFELSDAQMYMLFQCLITLKNTTEYSSMNTNFMKALNKECLKRFFSKDHKTLLLISDAFYQLNNQKSDFLWRAIRKLVTKPHKLSAKALVQVLFLLNLANLGSTVNMFEIELRTEECVHEISVNELGIIARGFFLRKHGIKNKKLIALIINRTAKHAHMLNNVTLASIMKLVRYSDCLHCIHAFQHLLVALQKEIHKLSLRTVTHIAHAFGALHVYDELLTKYIAERIIKEVKHARLKDIERIIYGITTVTPFTNYYKDVCQTLVNEVLLTYQTNRLAEIQKYPSSLTRILTFVTIKSIYMPELLSYVFHPKFARAIYKNNIRLLTNELLTLHCSVKIDLPDYKGPTLEDHLYQYLIKTYGITDDEHKMDKSAQLRTELVFIAKNKLGIDVCVDYILPHYPCRDIVFGMDKQNNPINVEPILTAMPTGSIKSVNNDELEKISWHVFFILPNITEIVGHDGYSGTTIRRFRHFRAIGYNPILVHIKIWDTCSNEQEKENYLRQQINECYNISSLSEGHFFQMG